MERIFSTISGRDVTVRREKEMNRDLLKNSGGERFSNFAARVAERLCAEVGFEA